ncbi:MAG TPA: hypothetical protein VIL49_06890 [Capillimicrobium sp.]|jgi:hypothetical protein
MRTRTAVVALAAASAGLLAAPLAAARPPCDALPGRAILANERAVVVERADGSAVACHRGSRRVSRLWRGETPLPFGVLAKRLAGRHVGFVSAASDRFGGQAVFVSRIDTRTGARVVIPVGPGPGEPGPLTGVASFAMTAQGAMAWAVAVASPTRHVVFVARADGSEAVDRGPEVDPASLAAAGRTVYWTRAGAAMSVTTPGPASRRA